MGIRMGRMEVLVMSNDEQFIEEQGQDDARIAVILDGNSPVPKYIDFYKVTPFHLVAIGEWLALKGRQMIAMSEQAEAQRTGTDPRILVPGISPETVEKILNAEGR